MSVFAETLKKAPEQSPTQVEKDRAVQLARSVLRGEVTSASSDDLRALSAQLLRAHAHSTNRQAAVRSGCFVVALALGLAACQPIDPGGRIGDYLPYISTDQPVQVKGKCYSACVLKLAAKQVCVDEDARIGVHVARSALTGNTSAVATAFVEALLPPCVRSLFGPFTTNMSFRSGSEVLSACPQIHSCRAL